MTDTANGRNTAVATPIKLMAIAAKVPHSSLSCRATEVPTAWAVMPRAMPCASGMRTPRRDKSAGPIIAPTTPVINTNTAAKAATPPICSATTRIAGPPGLRLTETDLAARFGVSRTPVRQAIARLESEIAKLHTLLADPDLFAREPVKFRKATEAKLVA